MVISAHYNELIDCVYYSDPAATRSSYHAELCLVADKVRSQQVRCILAMW